MLENVPQTSLILGKVENVRIFAWLLNNTRTNLGNLRSRNFSESKKMFEGPFSMYLFVCMI